MNKPKDVKYYQEKVQESLSADESAELLQEVLSILAGMEKGLALLKKMERKPEKGVLENQKIFLKIAEVLRGKV